MAVVFRNTWHYEALWLALALAMVSRVDDEINHHNTIWDYSR